MKKNLKNYIIPGTVGAFDTFLLIVSFALSVAYSGNVRIDAFNTVLNIIEVVFAIHLVITTAEVQKKHIWQSLPLMVLWAVPVCNLLTIMCQLTFKNLPYIQNELFNLIVIIFSLPAFFCYYFFCVTNKVITQLRSKRILIATVEILYLVIRIVDKIIIPWLVSHGIAVSKTVMLAFGQSRWLSLAVYVAAFVGFILIIHSGHLRFNSEEAEKNTL